MRPNKDRRTEIILYGLLLIPLLFAAAALAQATEQAQGLAEITVVLSSILNNPMALKWCASTPKFLLAVLVLYPLAVYCYMLDQADRHPGAEHGTAKWGSAHRLNIKYRNTKDSKENYILTENVRFSTDSHAHKHMAYNLATILAEKLETVISRSDQNTRPRDYYDVYILTKLQAENIDFPALGAALMATASKRGSDSILQDYRAIVEAVRNSEIMRRQWDNYRKDFDYASTISFDEVCDAVASTMDTLITNNFFN